jgi:Ca2+:H+ antiporter
VNASGGNILKLFLSLNVLLFFVPFCLYLEHFQSQAHTLIFFSACLGIIPLAGWMGKATEQIADRAGEGIGGLLNATFGNAAELIIAIVALQAGYLDIVKASLTGSIIGNILLVLGASFLVGGLRYKIQEYNAITARAQAQMLLLVSVAVIIPALFHFLRPPEIAASEAAISLALAALLMVVYVFSLIFSLHTHKELFRGATHEETGGEKGHLAWNLPVALAVLGIATFFIAWLSEILVGSVEQAALQMGMSKVFVGIIIVAVIGNAAEHSTAVLAAMKNRMDLSVSIAIGSSTQVALFVTPLLVFLSYLIAPRHMDLIFTLGEVFAIVISASLVAHTTSDGKSNWFTGLLLLTVYLVMAVAFFHVPG